MNIVEFSVLSYYPSIFTQENINVGVLFHILKPKEVSGKRSFYSIKKLERLAAFDDELDITFMRDYLSGIKLQATDHLFNNDAPFSLKDFVRFYVNELRFSDVQSVELEENEVDDFIRNTCKLMMRYDFDKKDRLKKNDEIKYFKTLLTSNHLSFSTSHINGAYNEKLTYDFIVGNYVFKSFSFNEKAPSKMMQSVKYWAFNAFSLKGKYKTVFIYDAEQKDSPDFEILINIMKRNADYVLKADEVAAFITTTLLSVNQ